MDDPSPAQIAYFNGAATRQELFTVLLATAETASAVVTISVADTKAERIAALGPLTEQLAKLRALMREMLNEGVDPEWDYRS